MNSIKDFVPLAELFVKELIEQIDTDTISLKRAEEKIVNFVNKIGHFMFQEVAGNCQEPVIEDRVSVNGKIAKYHSMRNLRFIDRFGQEIIRRRRCYTIEDQSAGYYPLDEKLGLDKCRRFSPLMTYLLSFFGACEAYDPSSKKLSKALGFNMSATAVQANTEMTGDRLEHHPFDVIPASQQNKECDVMIVETDGTMSPQIAQEEGVTGRESLKLPTEYKECNILVIQKFKNGNKTDEWIGGQYGPRKEFEKYLHQAGLRMGQLKAEEVVFIADGAKHNWEMQMNHFPYAICILDFYHVTEHLSEFCDLFKNKSKGKMQYDRWYDMLYDGEVLQVLSEMKKSLEDKIANTDAALKHYNYFINNQNRMQYDRYREKNYPIGSGLIEGKCKLVVNRRFKGNGMRWKKADNESVLDVRLAVFNESLEQAFTPTPQSYKLASGF